MSSRNMKQQSVQLSEIRIEEQLDDVLVQELVKSISHVGLLQPPMISRVADGVVKVVFGRHRIEAARRAGLESIVCRVAELSDLEAEVAEIDENLVRKKLTAAEEAKLLYRRKALYEAEHGPAKARGINAANRAMGNASADLAPAFSEDAAEKTGRSRRSIQRAVARAERLGGHVLNELQGTALDSPHKLDRLAALSPEDRAAEIRNAAAGSQPDVKSKKTKKRTAPLKPIHVDELRKGWRRASMSTRLAFARWVMKSEPTLWTQLGAESQAKAKPAQAA